MSPVFSTKNNTENLTEVLKHIRVSNHNRNITSVNVQATNDTVKNKGIFTNQINAMLLRQPKNVSEALIYGLLGTITLPEYKRQITHKNKNSSENVNSDNTNTQQPDNQLIQMPTFSARAKRSLSSPNSTNNQTEACIDEVYRQTVEANRGRTPKKFNGENTIIKQGKRESRKNNLGSQCNENTTEALNQLKQQNKILKQQKRKNINSNYTSFMAHSFIKKKLKKVLKNEIQNRIIDPKSHLICYSSDESNSNKKFKSFSLMEISSGVYRDALDPSVGKNIIFLWPENVSDKTARKIFLDLEPKLINKINELDTSIENETQQLLQTTLAEMFDHNSNVQSVFTKVKNNLRNEIKEIKKQTKARTEGKPPRQVKAIKRTAKEEILKKQAVKDKITVLDTAYNHTVNTVQNATDSLSQYVRNTFEGINLTAPTVTKTTINGAHTFLQTPLLYAITNKQTANSQPDAIFFYDVIWPSSLTQEQARKAENEMRTIQNFLVNQLKDQTAEYNSQLIQRAYEQIIDSENVGFLPGGKQEVLEKAAHLCDQKLAALSAEQLTWQTTQQILIYTENKELLVKQSLSNFAEQARRELEKESKENNNNDFENQIARQIQNVIFNSNLPDDFKYTLDEDSRVIIKRQISDNRSIYQDYSILDLLLDPDIDFENNDRFVVYWPSQLQQNFLAIKTAVNNANQFNETLNQFKNDLEQVNKKLLAPQQYIEKICLKKNAEENFQCNLNDIVRVVEGVIPNAALPSSADTREKRKAYAGQLHPRPISDSFVDLEISHNTTVGNLLLKKDPYQTDVSFSTIRGGRQLIFPNNYSERSKEWIENYKLQEEYLAYIGQLKDDFEFLRSYKNIIKTKILGKFGHNVSAIKTVTVTKPTSYLGGPSLPIHGPYPGITNLDNYPEGCLYHVLMESAPDGSMTFYSLMDDKTWTFNNSEEANEALKQTTTSSDQEGLSFQQWILNHLPIEDRTVMTPSAAHLRLHYSEDPYSVERLTEDIVSKTLHYFAQDMDTMAHSDQEILIKNIMQYIQLLEIPLLALAPSTGVTGLALGLIFSGLPPLFTAISEDDPIMVNIAITEALIGSALELGIPVLGYAASNIPQLVKKLRAAPKDPSGNVDLRPLIIDYGENAGSDRIMGGGLTVSGIVRRNLRTKIDTEEMIQRLKDEWASASAINEQQVEKLVVLDVNEPMTCLLHPINQFKSATSQNRVGSSLRYLINRLKAIQNVRENMGAVIAVISKSRHSTVKYRLSLTWDNPNIIYPKQKLFFVLGDKNIVEIPVDEIESILTQKMNNQTLTFDEAAKILNAFKKSMSHTNRWLLAQKIESHSQRSVIKSIDFSKYDDYINFVRNDDNGKIKAISVTTQNPHLELIGQPDWYKSLQMDSTLNPYHQILSRQSEDAITDFHYKNNLPPYKKNSRIEITNEHIATAFELQRDITHFYQDKNISLTDQKSIEDLLDQLINYLSIKSYNSQIKLITAIDNPYTQQEKKIKIILAIKKKNAPEGSPHYIFDPKADDLDKANTANNLLNYEPRWLSLQRQKEGVALFERRFDTVENLNGFLYPNKVNPNISTQLGSQLPPAIEGPSTSSLQTGVKRKRNPSGEGDIIQPETSVAQFLYQKRCIHSPPWYRERAPFDQVTPWERQFAKEDFGREPIIQLDGIIEALYKPDQSVTDNLKNKLSRLRILPNTLFLDVFDTVKSNLVELDCSNIKILVKKTWFENHSASPAETENLIMLTRLVDNHKVHYVVNPTMMLANPDSHFLISMNEWQLAISQGTPNLASTSNYALHPNRYKRPLVKVEYFDNILNFSENMLYGNKNSYSYLKNGIILSAPNWYTDTVKPLKGNRELSVKNYPAFRLYTNNYENNQHLYIYAHGFINQNSEINIPKDMLLNFYALHGQYIKGVDLAQILRGNIHPYIGLKNLGRQQIEAKYYFTKKKQPFSAPLDHTALNYQNRDGTFNTNLRDYSQLAGSKKLGKVHNYQFANAEWVKEKDIVDLINANYKKFKEGKNRNLADVLIVEEGGSPTLEEILLSVKGHNYKTINIVACRGPKISGNLANTNTGLLTHAENMQWDLITLQLIAGELRIISRTALFATHFGVDQSFHATSSNRTVEVGS